MYKLEVIYLFIQNSYPLNFLSAFYRSGDLIQYTLVSRIPGDLIQYTLVSRIPGDLIQYTLVQGFIQAYATRLEARIFERIFF